MSQLEGNENNDFGISTSTITSTSTTTVPVPIIKERVLPICKFQEKKKEQRVLATRMI